MIFGANNTEREICRFSTEATSLLLLLSFFLLVSFMDEVNKWRGGGEQYIVLSCSIVYILSTWLYSKMNRVVCESESLRTSSSSMQVHCASTMPLGKGLGL